MTTKVEFLKPLNKELNIVLKQPLGGVLKTTAVHLPAKVSKDTSSFTNAITYNFQFISIIFCIFSNKQPGHLFQNCTSTWAEDSRAYLMKGVAYSTIGKNYN